MEKDDKWGMFKNFMYNEIGITKADIRIWIKETVQEESKKLAEQSFGTWSIKELITKEITKEISNSFRTGIRSQICEDIGKQVLEKIVKEEFKK